MTSFGAFRKALPFWLSLGLVPLAALAIGQGGWTVLLLPAFAWALVTVLDLLLGRNEENPDPQTDETELFWYRLITLAWFPVQALLLCWLNRSMWACSCCRASPPMLQDASAC